mmetsp:Transcript_114157/g.227177  ORF Transcript_114157/g.227177 Transcript_114157/m.227177 type:complete len:210 (+) Transcript_114157:58-687(+)
MVSLQHIHHQWSATVAWEAAISIRHTRYRHMAWAHTSMRQLSSHSRHSFLQGFKGVPNTSNLQQHHAKCSVPPRRCHSLEVPLPTRRHNHIPHTTRHTIHRRRTKCSTTWLACGTSTTSSHDIFHLTIHRTTFPPCITLSITRITLGHWRTLLAVSLIRTLCIISTRPTIQWFLCTQCGRDIGGAAQDLHRSRLVALLEAACVCDCAGG